jgi:two-component system chemotaxis response regulator CheY
MAGKRVLSIGQCDYDHGNIARMLRHHFGAEAVPAADGAQALEHLRKGPFHLILVNRILDRSGEEGLEVIRLLRGQPELAATPIMLVSNYSSAQEQAVEIGAVPGFGKDALTHGSTLQMLRSYFEVEERNAASSQSVPAKA